MDRSGANKEDEDDSQVFLEDDVVVMNQSAVLPTKEVLYWKDSFRQVFIYIFVFVIRGCIDKFLTYHVKYHDILK